MSGEAHHPAVNEVAGTRQGDRPASRNRRTRRCPHLGPPMQKACEGVADKKTTACSGLSALMNGLSVPVAQLAQRVQVFRTHSGLVKNVCPSNSDADADLKLPYTHSTRDRESKNPTRPPTTPRPARCRSGIPPRTADRASKTASIAPKTADIGCKTSGVGRNSSDPRRFIGESETASTQGI